MFLPVAFTSSLPQKLVLQTRTLHSHAPTPQHYEAANEFSISKTHASHLTLLHPPRLELQNNIVDDGRALPFVRACPQPDPRWLLLAQLWIGADSHGVSQFGNLFYTTNFTAALFSFRVLRVFLREKALWIELAEICNFLFTGNPVVLGKSLQSYFQNVRSLKNTICKRDHPYFH